MESRETGKEMANDVETLWNFAATIVTLILNLLQKISFKFEGNLLLRFFEFSELEKLRKIANDVETLQNFAALLLAFILAHLQKIVRKFEL